MPSIANNGAKILFWNESMSFVENYFRQSSRPRLHIGCGDHILPEWLNCDLDPSGDQVVKLDATQPFPFNDNAFDFIFTEHMIEHINFSHGLSMLRECYRVLKPGGVIRISTPDFKFLIDLYQNPTKQSNLNYIRWAVKSFVPEATTINPLFVINSFVRDWDHTFIYDKNVLEGALLSVGFLHIDALPVGRSVHQELISVENHKRMPLDFLELETMTLEATKHLNGSR